MTSSEQFTKSKRWTSVSTAEDPRQPSADSEQGESSGETGNQLQRAVSWAGIDVGASRKGFHVAVLAEGAPTVLRNLLSPERVVAFLVEQKPRVIAIDSPMSCARPGGRWRRGERHFSVCGIRFTPDEDAIRQSDYYAWIRHGLDLYRVLRAAPTIHNCRIIECFPTASWTRWLGARGTLSRAAWSRGGLSRMGLAGLPSRMNQDYRDAIAAARTAQLYGMHRADAPRVERFGSIIVPL